MDQCTHCTAIGDMDTCSQLECSHHDTWYATELRQQLADEKHKYMRTLTVITEMKNQIADACAQFDSIDTFGIRGTFMRITKIG